MTICKRFAVVCCLIMFVLSVPRIVRADEWDQATKLTFSEAVEVPGMVLPAGTYWFTLMDDPAERNIVQIWSEDRTHLIADILTINDHRQQATGETVIKFEERPRNQPEAIEAWFYPGDDSGHEFVYPKARASELAKQNKRPVLSTRDELPSTTHPAPAAAMKQAHIKATNPNGDELELKEIIQEPVPTPRQQ